MKRVWKICRRVLFWTFFITLFFTTVTTVILHIYEDDIKQYAITELNSHLETDVEVRNIELSIFHDFPNASLAFEHVFIADAYEEIESEDTLLFAEEVFFNFNLWDLWSGDYKVKRASVHQGQINLKTTDSGDANYNIVKTEKDSVEEESNFEFLLELLKLEQVEFNFVNQSTSQLYRLNIHEALLRGDFASDDYQLLADGKLHVNELKSGSLTLISDKEAELDLALDINTLSKSYRFNRGDLNVEDMLFNITGSIDSSQIDLEIIGQQIEIAQVVNSLVPDENEAKAYGGEGIVNFVGSVSGGLSRHEMPSIQAEFAVENASVTEPENQLKIYDINLKGSYQNAQEDRQELLDFNAFSFKLLNSYLEGVGKLENFEQPTLTTKANGNLDLNAFHRFFSFKDVKELRGNVRLNMACIIQFFDPEYRKDKFKITQSDGSISLSNVVYQSVNESLKYTDISGDILINGKDAAAKNLSIKTPGSDILINGAMKNFVPYIEGSGSLGLIASLDANQIDLNEFSGGDNGNNDGPPTVFQLPGDLNLNLEMNVHKFLWDKHEFNEITGQLLLANRKITINRVNLKTLGGKVSGKLVLNNLLENGNIVDGNMRFSSINIKKLFADWENFKQETITDEHLSGTVNGKVNFLLSFNPYFSIMEENIYALSDITIRDGELVNMETMKAITDYMRSNKGLKLMLNKHIDRFEEKLMNLRFSEMTNKIEIKDRRINIPKMVIKSNALDVELFGWHDFDNNIEYHFSFRFRQLKTKPEYTEFGKIEDDGLGIVIYMTMYGHIDDPSFSLDKDERKNDIKENISDEKETVKSMLKSEFGMFRKDTTIDRFQKDNKNEVEFIYYETDLENENEPQDTTKKTKNKKRAGKFFDKLKEDAEKDKEEVEYESDLIE